MKRQGSLNHARVSTYKITMNDRFDSHFLINPNYIYEKELLFVYKDGDSEIQKTIPIAALIKHFRIKRFFGRDPQTLCSKFKGYAYEVPADVVFTYK